MQFPAADCSVSNRVSTAEQLIVLPDRSLRLPNPADNAGLFPLQRENFSHAVSIQMEKVFDISTFRFRH